MTSRISENPFSLLKPVFWFFPLVLSVFLWFFSSYWFGRHDTYINSDGQGYYEYLPAIFIHHNLPHYSDSARGTVPHRVYELGAYNYIGDCFINKYPAGTALLQLPFFSLAHLSVHLSGQTDNGYGPKYQFWIRVAAFFYVFAALWALSALLALSGLANILIYIIVLAVTCATSLFFYMGLEPAFSHIYSFFTINVALLFFQYYLRYKHQFVFLLFCLFAGITFFIRPVNILFLLSLPAFVLIEKGSIQLKNLVSFSALVKGFIVFVLPLILHFSLNYYQTGKLILDTYVGESFDFKSPHIVDILFSFRKGLFVYAPVLLFVLPGFYYMLKMHKPAAIYLFVFLLLITYIFSSWHSWEYGYTFGSRVYIEYYAFFVLISSYALKSIKWPAGSVLFFLLLFFIYASMIQSWQVKYYVLDGFNTDYIKYKKFFLRKEDKFKGAGVKIGFSLSEFKRPELLIKMQLPDTTVMANQWGIYYKPVVPDSLLKKTKLILFEFESDFSDEYDAAFILEMRDAQNQPKVYYNPGFLSFADKNYNEFQTGSNSVLLPDFNDTLPLKITIQFDNKGESFRIKNLKMYFFNRVPPR